MGSEVWCVRDWCRDLSLLCTSFGPWSAQHCLCSPQKYSVPSLYFRSTQTSALRLLMNTCLQPGHKTTIWMLFKKCCGHNQIHIVDVALFAHLMCAFIEKIFMKTTLWWHDPGIIAKKIHFLWAGIYHLLSLNYTEDGVKIEILQCPDQNHIQRGTSSILQSKCKT